MDAEKTILITGGAGSLGSQLVKEIVKLKLKCRIFDNNEFALYKLEEELSSGASDVSNLRYLYGDIRDKERLHRAMVGVDVVIHTAALKHVPICEYNPIDAVKTNILGSINVIEESLNNNVKKVLAISSDKAVHPINIYGATKLAMEKLFKDANVYGDTKFSCTRFGNFNLSQGNVLQRWYKESENGVLTITEKEMTRFWICVNEAAEFTLKCVDMMEGGEVFIPKMEEQSILDIARKVNPDAKLNIIGKRQGEKLHELLYSEDEKILDKGDYFLVE